MIVSRAKFKAYPAKLVLTNRCSDKGSSKAIKMELSEIEISDQDLAVVKNLSPDNHVQVTLTADDLE